ncbi:MAG: type II CAAX endopeptidase family protein [Sphingorhabdus sp.]
MRDDNLVNVPAPPPTETAEIDAKSGRALALIVAFGAVFLFLFSQFLFGLVAVIIAAVGVAGGGISQEGLMEVLKDPSVIALPTIWSVLISNIFVFGILWLYLRRGDRLERLGWNRWSAVSWWKTIAIAGLCIAASLGFNIIYTEYIFPDLDMQRAMRELFAAIPKTAGNQILLFATVAVVAPVVEEVLFRGMLQTSFAAYMPPWAAILLSAAIFGFIHFQPEAIGALMALGIAFGAIYHFTKSLRVTILLHVLNNSAALLLTPPAT